MPLDDEITFESLAEDGQAPLDRLSKVIDAIDAASDQDHTTWITGDGGSKRIARIAPVENDPDVLRAMTEDEITRIARDELDELLEFAGQIRAAMRTTRLAYDALFGASGARLRAGRPQSPLICGQAVLFCRDHPDSDWEPGVFIRYDGGSDAVLQDAGGHPVILSRTRVLPAAPADLGAALAAKRAETEPVWRAAATERLPVSRGLLVQVLTDAGLDEAKAETVWDVLHDLTYGIHPDGKPVGRPEPARSGRPEDAEPSKVTPRGPLTLEVLSDALSLTGVSVRMEILDGWTFAQRVDAYDWAIREHLHASGNDIARAARPSFIPGDLDDRA